MFSSLKDVDGWLKEKAKGFEYIGKYGIEYKGQKVRVKRIEGLNMYYLDMPTYFTF